MFILGIIKPRSVNYDLTIGLQKGKIWRPAQIHINKRNDLNITWLVHGGSGKRFQRSEAPSSFLD